MQDEPSGGNDACTLSSRRRIGRGRSPSWTGRLYRMANAAGRSFDTGRKTLRQASRRLRGALDPGGSMRRTPMTRAVLLGLVALLVLPAAAMADTFDAAGKGLPDSVGINSMWVIVAGCFVMFMQAGFAFLEIGFSRGKNAGTVVAKILINFSIAAIAWWAIGFMLAFSGPLGGVVGHQGGAFFTNLGPYITNDGGTTLFRPDFPVMALSNATLESKMFFQFAFCAVSLAIVWGTTLERIK